MEGMRRAEARWWRWRRLFFWILLMESSWWILTEGRAGWGAGLTVGGIAGLLYRREPAGGQPCRFGELMKFLPFFFWHSLLGGVDVARRVLDPRLPLAPSLLVHPLLLPEGAGRVFLVNVISLQPGTLSTDVRGNELWVHSLDEGNKVMKKLVTMERLVSAIFPGQGSASPSLKEQGGGQKHV